MCGGFLYKIRITRFLYIAIIDVEKIIAFSYDIKQRACEGHAFCHL